MTSSVYLETSVVSYLAARQSRDVLTSAHQQLTLEWWNSRRPRFAVHISELVVQEAKVGDDDAVRRRLAFLDGLPILTLGPDALDLA